MDIKQSKSILARLLAKENLTVQHKNIPTAYFDTKNRLLALPTWKDMSTDLYDLLTGHEVGHALYTPSEGWHDQIHDKDFGNHFKGFLNVLEDARIEKLIKRTYPGLRKNFYQAYKELFDKDFFGVNDTDLDDLLFIDRVNLHFKLGSFLAVDFTPEESVIVNEIAKMETWEEVVALARRMYDMAREELEEKKKEMLSKGDIMEYEMNDASEGTDQSQGDDESSSFENNQQDVQDQLTEMTEPESITDKAFRSRETELLDEKSLPYNYYTVSEYDASPYIWNYKTMLELHKFTPEQEARRNEIYNQFKAKNLKFVNYLVKEFELRRNAQQFARAQVSKSGEIDVKKLFKYQISEDLFLKVTSIPKGKNHGLVMFYDMSGSMSNSIAGVIEQILILVEFCRKINIPFEVYGFTNDGRAFWDDTSSQRAYRDSFADRKHLGADNDLVITCADFRLQQYFSNTMSASDYKRMVQNLCMVKKTWDNMYGRRQPGFEFDYDWSGTMPACEHLHSTPLTSTIALSRSIFNKFKARTGAEIVNMVFLTDGESDGDMRARRIVDNIPDTTYIEAGHRYNSFITDTKTKMQVQLKGRQATRALTTGLLEMTRAITGCNIVGFFLTNNVKNTVSGEIFQSDRWLRNHDAAEEAQVARVMEEYKRDRVAVVTTSGYNEYYIVKNDLSFNDEFEVEADADVKDISRAFRKMQRGKLLNRVLLNRFIRMIA